MRTHRPTQVIDDDGNPDVPSAATGHMLHGDPMAQLATTTADHARHAPGPYAAPGPEYAPLVTESRRSSGWQPRLIAFAAGVAVELLGRDDCRDRADIVNQSSAVTGSTNPALVFLFSDEQQARNFADDSAAQQSAWLARGLRTVVLPDGAARTLKHTAPVWAVAYGSTDLAVVDVSAERRSQR